MSDNFDRNPDECRIVKYVGTPHEPLKPNESTRWARFWRAVGPWAEKSGLAAKYVYDLALKYALAEVEIKKGAAAKAAAEAADLAAAEDLKRQQKVKVVNDEIERIFSQNDVPPAAKQLQLANLFATNPELLEQLKLIKEMCEQLGYTFGTKVELVRESPGETAVPQLKAADEDEDSGSDLIGGKA